MDTVHFHPAYTRFYDCQQRQNHRQQDLDHEASKEKEVEDWVYQIHEIFRKHPVTFNGPMPEIEEIEEPKSKASSSFRHSVEASFREWENNDVDAKMPEPEKGPKLTENLKSQSVFMPQSTSTTIKPGRKSRFTELMDVTMGDVEEVEGLDEHLVPLARADRVKTPVRVESKPENITLGRKFCGKIYGVIKQTLRRH